MTISEFAFDGLTSELRRTVRFRAALSSLGAALLLHLGSWLPFLSSRSHLSWNGSQSQQTMLIWIQVIMPLVVGLGVLIFGLRHWNRLLASTFSVNTVEKQFLINYKKSPKIITFEDCVEFRVSDINGMFALGSSALKAYCVVQLVHGNRRIPHTTVVKVLKKDRINEFLHSLPKIPLRVYLRDATIIKNPN